MIRLIIPILIVLIIVISFEGLQIERVNQLRAAEQAITPTPIITSTPTPVQLNAKVLFNDVNTWRIKNGYKPFMRSQELCNVAMKRIPEIKIKATHDGIWKYWNNMQFLIAGENLAENFIFEEAVLNGWINSPEHYANLIKPYTYSCIETDGQYVVEEFASF